MTSFEKTMSFITIIVGVAFTFLFLTSELNHVLSAKMPEMAAGGRSILWAVFGFVFLLRGLRQSRRWLRYLGLALLSIVVVKVFLIDLEKLEAIYRVVSFLVFGILLMASAFVYLKFWHTKSE